LTSRPWPGCQLDVAAQLITDALKATGAQGIRAVGITVALPGGADAATGSLDVSVSLGWRDVQIIEPLRQRLTAHGAVPPMTPGNDAHLATVAEYVAAAGSGIRDMHYAKGLARGSALLVDVFDPRLVVLGGYFTQFGDFLLDTVRRTIAERAFNPDTACCEVRLSTYRFDSTIRGAAQHALEAILLDPAKAMANSTARSTAF
jgi:predicted NBD/HSP70 family sugar kinase